MRKEALFSEKVGLCCGLAGSHCRGLAEKGDHGERGSSGKEVVKEIQPNAASGVTGLTYKFVQLENG